MGDFLGDLGGVALLDDADGLVLARMGEVDDNGFRRFGGIGYGHTQHKKSSDKQFVHDFVSF